MSSNRTPYALGAITGIAVGLAVLLALVLTNRAPTPVDEPPRGPVTVTKLESEPDPAETIEVERGNAIVEASRRVSPSVVSINSIRPGTSGFRSVDELFRFFLGDQAPPSDMGLGSGFIVDHRGYILTNHHVVENGSEIVVTLSNGQHYAANLIDASIQHDLALLKLSGEVSGLPAVEFGDSDDLQIGEWAIAIGSPFGYLLEDTSPTVTVGVISAVKRDLRGDQFGRVGGAYYYDMLQTDASINPGNSGGPLVNAKGQVIGMNTFLISDEQGGGSVGVGFAVPSSRCRWILEEVLEHGYLRQAYAGILESELITEYRTRMDATVGQMPRGLLVRTVLEDSPADEAGLQPRDVIIAINGDSLVDDRTFIRSLYDTRVGTKLVLTVWRDGRTFDTSLVLVELARRAAPRSTP